MAEPSYLEWLKRILEGSGPGSTPTPAPTPLKQPTTSTSVPGSTPSFIAGLPYTDPVSRQDSPVSAGDEVALPPALLSAIAEYYGIRPEDLAFMQSADPAAWVKLVKGYWEDTGQATAGGTGSGGGASRFLFPEEQRQLELQNAALERELELSRMGASRFEEFNGVLFDPLTGEIYDPTNAGLGRDAHDLNKSRFDFESGSQFEELIRQFNEQQGTTRRGQDLNYDLGNKAESRLMQALGLETELGRGNLQLGRDRLNLDTELGRGNQTLEKNRQIQEILSRPSDAVASLFMNRGRSFSDKITQADLINELNAPAPVATAGGFEDPNAKGTPTGDSYIRETNQRALDFILGGGMTNPTASDPTSVHLTNLANTPGSAITDYGQLGFGLNQGDNYKYTQKTIDELGTFEEGTEGGPVRSKLAIVGEKGPELLLNHGDGSFDVVSNEDSKLLEGLIDWITRAESKRTTIRDERPKSGRGAGGGGGGSFGGKLSNLSKALPNFAEGTLDLFPTEQVEQNKLIGYAQRAAGPGVNAVLQGRDPGNYALPGLPTPTAMGFNRLSGSEKDALNSRLAVEFNSTLEDLMHQISQRYGTNNSRRARFLT